MTNSVRKRKKLTAEKKYAVIEEGKRNSGTKSEILRREGLYSTDLQRYEEIACNGWCIQGIKWVSAGKNSCTKEATPEAYEALKRELEKKEKALADLAMQLFVIRLIEQVSQIIEGENSV